MTVPGDATSGPHVPWVLRSHATLVAAVLLVVGVPFAVFAALAAAAARSALEDEAIRENTTAARLGAEAVSAHFEGLAQYVGAMAARPGLTAAVARADPAAVREFLRGMLETNPSFERAFVADADGVLRYDWPEDPAVAGRSFAHRDWYRGVAAGSGVHVSEVYVRQAAPRKRVVAVAARVAGEGGTRAGYLVAQYAVDAMTQRVTSMMPAAHGRLTLIDRNGHVVGTGPPDASLPVLGAGPLADAVARAGDTGVVAPSPVDGAVSLISLGRAEPGSWVVLAEQPEGTVFAPCRTIALTIGGLGLVCLAGALVLGLRALTAVRRHAVALVELQTAKDQLSGMLVHDLRNPLTATLGWIELARGKVGLGQADLRRILDDANVAAERLLEMINTLVDVVRMEDGRMPIERGRHDLAALVRAKVEQHLGTAGARTVSLHADVPPDPVEAEVDASLVGRVLENLLTNALKHTPAGGEVVVSLEAESAGGVTLRVRDTGEGIAAEDLPRLFQKHGRAHGQTLGRRYDTGLGLVFCRLAAERHGGSISVVSTPGAGSTFDVRLPRAAVARPGDAS